MLIDKRRQKGRKSREMGRKEGPENLFILKGGKKIQSKKRDK
jgi:hypothetical protein